MLRIWIMKSNFFKLLTIFFLYSVFSMGCLAQTEPDENFQSFLTRFTTSASFQLERVTFPIATPILLIDENGDDVKTPFTQEEWLLLGKEDLMVFEENMEYGVRFGRFSVMQDHHVEYECGLMESEIDLLVVFDLIDGQWRVTDCVNGMYTGIAVSEFDATVYEVQQQNLQFAEMNP